MKSKILTLAVLGLAPAALMLPGVVFAQTTTGTETAAETAAEPAAEGEADVAGGYTINSALAEVDGVALTLGEVIAIRRELPDQYQSLPDEVLMEGLVEQMVDQMLLAEAGRKAGLDMRPAIAMNLLNQRRAILADAYLRAEVEARATPEAVEALYKERYVDAEPQEEVRAAHILVPDLETANALKTELDAGADFAALAAEHGTDGTKSRGGDLGWFVHSEMVPAFADAAFSMEPGTVSDPVKSDFGWHLIKLDERRIRAVPALEEVRQALMGELIQKAQVAVLDGLRASSEVVMPDPPLPSQAIRDDALLDDAQ